MQKVCKWCGKIYCTGRKCKNKYYCSVECYSEKQNDEYRRRFAEENKMFDLVDYKSKKDITVQCKKCGALYNGDSSWMLKKNRCAECARLERERKEELANQIKDIDLKIKEILEIRAHLDTLLKRNTARIQRQEDHRETLRAKYKRNELRREGRIKANGKQDRDITLKKLFERDNGVCHLCGGRCDYSDYRQTEKAFIAGSHYPSIDHIVPLSKGGAHTWDNIKLAHFRCNSKRRNNPPIPINMV